MTTDLEALGPAIEAKAAIWARLGVDWRTQPVVANHGKPIIQAEFESAMWIGDVTIWITGEAELATVRLTDDWMVNKHYDLISPGDINVIVDEVAALLSEDVIPESAVTTYHHGLDKS